MDSPYEKLPREVRVAYLDSSPTQALLKTIAQQRARLSETIIDSYSCGGVPNNPSFLGGEIAALDFVENLLKKTW